MQSGRRTTRGRFRPISAEKQAHKEKLALFRVRALQEQQQNCIGERVRLVTEWRSSFETTLEEEPWFADDAGPGEVVAAIGTLRLRRREPPTQDTPAESISKGR